MKQKLRYDISFCANLFLGAARRYLKRDDPDFMNDIVFGLRGNAIRKKACVGWEFTSITILKSVIKIGRNAFLDAKAEEISYEGSPEEWAQIDIEEGNELLDPSIIHFNCDVETLKEGAANDEAPGQNQ